MSKKHLIILENAAKTLNIDVKEWLNQQSENGDMINLKKVFNQNDFNFIVFDDSTIINRIEYELNKKNISSNSELYFVLHTSMTTDINQLIDDYKKKFKTNNVINQSHIDDDKNNLFYQNRMPDLLFKENLIFKDIIEGVFLSKTQIEENNELKAKLQFLHKLLGGNYTEAGKIEFFPLDEKNHKRVEKR